MKRLLTFLLAVTLVFGIAACDGTTEDPVCVSPEVLIDGECVAPNVLPVLAGLDDAAILTGATFDPLAGVTATDDEDGNLNSSIVVSGVINLNAAGTYVLTYSITDSDGDTVTATRNVVITIPNAAPVLAGVEDLNIVINDTFDPATGVTATDAEDGDLTADIAITGTVDTSTLGTYTLTYTVEDSEALETIVTRDIIVNAVHVNNVPVIAGAEDVVVVLDATFDAMTGVTGTDVEDGDITADITVTGTVDTAVAGSYDLTYTVLDSEGAQTVVERTVVVNTLPVFAGIADFTIYLDDEFDPLAGISALDAEDGDVTANIIVAGAVDATTEDDYVLTYTVFDAEGGSVVMSRTITVGVLDLVYPNGFFNYKFASTELRHTFMAAAESYMMNNMYGGVPIYASGSFNLYSDRLQLPVDEYVAVMGFGTAFATMSADDSTVLMDDGLAGEVGEYTYRTHLGQDASTFNHWIYDDATSADVIGEFMDALYVYEFNAAKDGYEVNPSMAAANPAPMDTHLTETGKEVAKTWQITLRDDLEWFYHPDTDISNLPTGHEVIDANDFVDNYKHAIDNSWFRAISGGGDFLNESTGILNAQEYFDGEADWADVGIKLIDDLTFEFTFVNDMSDWNVRYWLSSFVMSPINLELYAELQDGENNTYGTTADQTGVTTIAYHGPYYLDYYEADKVLRFKENPNYHNPDKYFYTGKTMSIIADSAVAFQEFLAGKLEGIGLPTESYDAYKDHPGIKRVPGEHQYRIMINGLGTVEAQQEAFPGSTWVPEPILANQNFKMAMFFALDRQKLAEEVLKTYTTNMFLFTNAYLVDPELGIPYRFTEEGISVGEGLSPSTHGYNPDAANAYFLLAIGEMLAAETVVAGEMDDWTVITLDYHIYSGSAGQVLMGEYIKTAFELVFKDYDNYIRVELNCIPREFPAIYYDYMMIGEFDLSIGAISGSTLDAASFLEVFTSDNRSGFTLNWGVDSSVAEIEIDYTTFDGVRHLEMWSYDAITSVLNGELFVVNGEEGEVPAPKTTEITPTTFTFDIELFNSPDFNNITYTIQYYDLDAGYLDVPGQVGITPAASTVTITGMEPFFYGYDATGSILYRGDYQVVLNFGYAVDATKEGETVGAWFEMSGLLTKEFTHDWGLTTIAIVVDETDDTRVLTEVNVYEEQVDESMLDVTLALTVGFTDHASDITIDGVTPGNWYIVEFVFDDGTWQNVWFTATDAPYVEGTVTATDTGATFDIAYTTGYTGVIASYEVYLVVPDLEDGTVVPDTIVAGANVDYANLAAIVVTGLAAENDYYVVFTMDDALEQTTYITTIATP